ncbi:MAG: alpha-2-macroglobulin family protein [Chitinophagaceae bacterium]
MASFYENEGAKYDPIKDTTHRYALKKAMEILKNVLKDTSEKREGWVNSYNLLQQINRPDVSFEVEKVSIPDQPFRALIKYKNITSINLKLVRLDSMLKELSSNRYEDKYWQALRQAPVLRSWEQSLPNTGDFQMHSVEIKIDALPVGEYILVVSSADGVQNSVPTGAQNFYVSNISYLNQDARFFVLHRETGQPLANANVSVYKQQYDYKTYKYSKVSFGNFTTDKNGFFQITTKKVDRSNSYQLYIKYGADRLNTEDYVYSYYRSETPPTIEKQTFFFTDRSIYRPGQTVFFKAIVINKNGPVSTVADNFKATYFLENTNGEKIDSVALTTNGYGSVWSKFVLPINTLNGNFSIRISEGNNAIFFSVEEYKRPKFATTFEKVKGSYKVGDSITLLGAAKAYAGNTIEGAQVKYRVVRQPRFLYPLFFGRWLPQPLPMEITHGEMTTDKDGKFAITFQAIPDLSLSKTNDPVFDYHVYADVTDINGETRSGEEIVSAGYKSLILKVDVPQKIEVDSLRMLSIRTQNMSGEFEKAMVTVQLYPLVPEPRLIRKRYWQQPDQFVITKENFIKNFPHDEYKAESDFTTWNRGGLAIEKIDSTREDGSFKLPATKLNTGFYTIEITTKTKEGSTVKDLRFVELYDGQEKQMTQNQYLWVAADNSTVEPGQKAVLQIGSSAKDVFVIEQLVRKDSTQDASGVLSFFNISNQKKTFVFPVTEQDRGGFGVAYFFVKDNRIYQWVHTIEMPWQNKELKIDFATFRDKTEPGSTEKWKVKITGYKGEKVAAEMLASMYDASLDQFKPHEWVKPSIWPTFFKTLSWNGFQNFTPLQSEQKYIAENNKYFDKQYDRFFFSDFGNRQQMEMRTQRSAPMKDAVLNEVVTDSTTEIKVRSGGISIRGLAVAIENKSALIMVDGRPVTSAATINPEDIISTTVLKGEEAIKLYGAKGANGVVLITTKNGTPIQEIQVRKNFDETAFFFPDLLTDKDGNVEFSFTTPEALTRWKLQTLAHTKDGAFGLAQREMETQKELMVQPNMPRFLRQGDRMELSVKVVNVSGKELTGQVQLELIDATTNQSVDGWFQNVFPNQFFTVAAGGSEAVKFPIEVPFQFNNALTWRVTATAGNVSDGEEQLIPILTNKVLVTETLPIPMRGSGTKNFIFKNLLQSGNSETLHHQSLTVEYTANPAWYAVQALPYLMQVSNESSEQTWNRYFANALAAHIVKSAPRIKEIFEQWKTKDTAALLSNLEKNTELKSILLQETPWVLAAQTESARKKNLGLLFDLVRMKGELKTDASKLKEMQSENGGFVWFKGGPDDRYMTQYIVSSIGHLLKLTGPLDNSNKELSSIIAAAIPYLDKKIIEDYEQLKKGKGDLKKVIPQSLAIQYLYLRSFFPQIKIPAATQQAYNYYLQQSKINWITGNKNRQAMTALVMYRTGDVATAKAIVKSLKETAILDKEQGMYWKDNSFGRSWYWYEAPIETQALLIETFSEITQDASAISDMQTWLLKNKQTNNWQTTKATAEACYALLLQGADLLQHEPLVQIKIGKTVITTEQGSEAGTGYIKQTIKGEMVQPEMGTITVTVKNGPATKSNTNATWGAVYWQYFEDLDKVKTAQTPLQLNKKLFKETMSDRGPVLMPLVEGTSLLVGDKIKVRIELRADRDMEYVHLKDMRASALEPINVLSGYKWQGGLGYYESTKEASTSFFFTNLRKGTYVFEYTLFVTHSGTFSNGISTIQSMYAPEFAAHSEGVKITVE